MHYTTAFENSQGRVRISGLGFAALTFLIEFAVIVATAVCTGVGYHLAVYGTMGRLDLITSVGVIAALLYTMPFVYRNEYSVPDVLERRRVSRRSVMVWMQAFLGLAAIGFLTRSTADVSRGWLAIFFVCGLLALLTVNALFEAVLQRSLRSGLLRLRRLVLVGSGTAVHAAADEVANSMSGVEVVGLVALPAAPAASLGSGQLLAQLRSRQAEDVLIVADGLSAEATERLVEEISVLPVNVHVGTAALGRFVNPTISQLSGIVAVSTFRTPLDPLQRLTKRAFDIVIAGLVLVLIAPLLGLVAVAVKLDSNGPVFFRQRRRGFNQKEFLIWKFRTMTTLEDGDAVRQVRPGDERVTRIGRLLRKYNLDELPQLINVLKGDMSLVGPRPHAIAHDAYYEKIMTDYPRRLKVQPGITGWAQVNGFRGPTDTDVAMRSRVDHDLFYVQNWSIALDVYILVLTVFSPKAYRNAL
ncbi:MAG: exopolysaccharide biosynthesis polyprenyl glycosylphosphotransferase [Hyphomicrobiaceae bacterium]|nr:exopolysaccharide biosynthesis polyprenyl glycosylphosphotransferase [Hyphomicrobiaceae bacterium]